MASTTFSKLQLKDQTEILVLGAPESFESDLSELAGVRIVRDPETVETIGFALAFVMTQEQVEAAAGSILQKAPGDAVLWFAYPKGTSKKYKSAITRDSGWQSLGRAGLEPVRQVAIDQDWSALRFRRVEFITKMKRRQSFALSEAGKAKTTSQE